MPKRPAFYTNLCFQVLVAIAIGVIFGVVSPEHAAAMRPLGDGFIKLVKMLIAPIVFTTVVVGIAHMGEMKDVGRIGLRALVYFEVMSTVALVIGLIVVTVLQPGAGVGFNPATADASSVAAYTTASQHLSTVDFILNVIPDTIVGGFARGDVLQVLLFSVLFGLALLRLEAEGPPPGRDHQRDDVGRAVRRGGPHHAPRAGWRLRRHGLHRRPIRPWIVARSRQIDGRRFTPQPCAFFIFVVLGTIARLTGFSLIRFLRIYRRGDPRRARHLLLRVGAPAHHGESSNILAVRSRLSASWSRAGYSLNLDGTSIYMTMAAIFVAQASGVHLSLTQELGILGVLLLTSKGLPPLPAVDL